MQTTHKETKYQNWVILNHVRDAVPAVHFKVLGGALLICAVGTPTVQMRHRCDKNAIQKVKREPSVKVFLVRVWVMVFCQVFAPRAAASTDSYACISG